MAEHDDTPVSGRRDDLQVERIGPTYRFAASDESLSAALVAAINAMGGTGDDAEDRYQRQLDILRERASDVVRALADEYTSLDEHAYVDRWALLHIAGEMRLPDSIGFFDRVLSAETPEERWPDGHDYSSRAEEVLLCTTAVDGLEQLLAGGRFASDALGILVRHVTHPEFSVRRAAVQAVVASGDEQAIGAVRDRLHERAEGWLLEVRRVPVDSVPQADGERYLLHPDAIPDVPPPGQPG